MPSVTAASVRFSPISLPTWRIPRNATMRPRARINEPEGDVEGCQAAAGVSVSGLYLLFDGCQSCDWHAASGRRRLVRDKGGLGTSPKLVRWSVLSWRVSGALTALPVAVAVLMP